MTDEPKTCPECGASLVDAPAEGLCPKCLLKAGFASRVSSHDSATSDSQSATNIRSSDTDAPTPAELNEKFPELEILSPLGQGGMGVVYKARQRRLDRFVALKILRSDLAGQPDFAERFTREARALARLQHSAVIGVHDFGLIDDLYFFIMEYVDGTNLRSLVKQGNLTPEEALAIVPKICDALQYAHNEGIVHRDIKPENILINRNGDVKIADFGLAKLINPDALDFTLTGTRQVMGTPMYMAPEQLERPSEVDHRADIYSLGVVFYEMLTGELPLGRFKKPSEKVQVDVRLDEVVLRTLEKEPDLRYQNISEVKTEVQSFHSRSKPRERSSTEPSGRESILTSYDSDWKSDFRIPAFGLLLVGIIDLIALPIMLATAGHPGGFVIFPMLCLPGFIAAIGGWHLLKRRSWKWAAVGACCALIPSHFGVFVGCVFGPWALWLLRKADFRSQFGPPASPRPLGEITSRVLDSGEQAVDHGTRAVHSGVKKAGSLFSKSNRQTAVQFLQNGIVSPLKIVSSLAVGGIRSFPFKTTIVWTMLVAAMTAAMFFVYGGSKSPFANYKIHESVTIAPRSSNYHSLRVKFSGDGSSVGFYQVPDGARYSEANIVLSTTDPTKGSDQFELTVGLSGGRMVFDHAKSDLLHVDSQSKDPDYLTSPFLADWIASSIQSARPEIAASSKRDFETTQAEANNLLKVLSKTDFAKDRPSQKQVDLSLFRTVDANGPRTDVRRNDVAISILFSIAAVVLLFGYWLIWMWFRWLSRRRKRSTTVVSAAGPIEVAVNSPAAEVPTASSKESDA